MIDEEVITKFRIALSNNRWSSKEDVIGILLSVLDDDPDFE